MLHAPLKKTVVSVRASPISRSLLYLFIRGYQSVRVVLYCLKISTQGPGLLRDYVAVGDIVQVPKFFSDSSGEEYIGSSQEAHATSGRMRTWRNS